MEEEGEEDFRFRSLCRPTATKASTSVPGVSKDSKDSKDKEESWVTPLFR